MKMEAWGGKSGVSGLLGDGVGVVVCDAVRVRSGYPMRPFWWCEGSVSTGQMRHNVGWA